MFICIFFVKLWFHDVLRLIWLFFFLYGNLFVHVANFFVLHTHLAASSIKFLTFPSCTWKGVVAPASTPHPNLRSQATRSPGQKIALPGVFSGEKCLENIHALEDDCYDVQLFNTFFNSTGSSRARVHVLIMKKSPKRSQCVGPSLAPSHLLRLGICFSVDPIFFPLVSWITRLSPWHQF